MRPKICCALRLILLALLPGSIMPARAETVNDSVSINFRQSKIALDPEYMDNPAAFMAIDSLIALRLNPDAGFRLTQINVSGGASPEGTPRFNEWLSRRRAEAVFRYVTSRISLPDSLTTFSYAGPDWKGLQRLAEADTRLPHREETMRLISDIIDAKERNGASTAQIRRLKAIHGGDTYRYLYRNLYPQLRASGISLQFTRPDLPAADESDSGIPDEIPPMRIDTIIIRDTVYVSIPADCGKCKPFYCNIRTNLLLDALALPNLGVEFYLGRGWSAGAEWTYGWWDSDRRHRYWRAYGGEINVRKWFGKKSKEKPLTGHHAGINAGVNTFDFEFGGKGYMGGVPGKNIFHSPFFTAGIEYGFSLPVARRLNIDFTAGIGWSGGILREYNPEDGIYVLQKTRRVNWFGPTKAAISLVWQLGCDNFNRAKGGKK